MTVGTPSPFVYWAQDLQNIYLKVDLKDVKEKIINIEPYGIEMGAEGVGAHGATYYHFRLNFYKDVVSKVNVEHQTKITDRSVEVVLRKEEDEQWPRLTKHNQKPAWLKVDFERWQSEEDDDDELPEINANKRLRDIHGDYPGLYEKLKKDEFGYRKEDMKKVYLVLYNLSQFVFYMYIFIVMAVRYAKENVDSMSGTYEAVGTVMKFCQLIQFLEVMHPLFGYTTGSTCIAFAQLLRNAEADEAPCIQMHSSKALQKVTGRAAILFLMVDAEPRMQTKPVIFYLFLIWSIIEIVRYPYYIAQLFKLDVSFLTWLRYSVWIPLYPLGILCEGIIILRNIPYFEETSRFSVAMPNSWNFTFHPPTVMKLYLLLLFFPGMYTMMKHMYNARVKKLGPNAWRKKLK